MSNVSPLLKWAGGKRHIAATIEQYFPKDWREGKYWEPFAGGAAMLLHLEPSLAQLSDINARLMNFYKWVKDDYRALVAQISSLAADFDAQLPSEKATWYYVCRDTFNDQQDSLGQASRMYVLNKLGFNGLYRENSQGRFNVPFGQKSEFPSITASNFETVAHALRNVDLRVASFSDIRSGPNEGDVVYFDPPYIPLPSSPSFTAYASGGFNNTEQAELAEIMRALAQKGVRAIASNSSTPATFEIYHGLQIETIMAPRMVSASGKGRGTVEEVVICNFQF